MRPTRLLSLIAALTLAATGALTATPVQAAAGDGTITVTMVDEHGDPMPGIVYLSSDSGVGFYQSQQAVSTATFTVPPGAYGVFAITPYGGMLCAGFDPCDYYALGGGGTPDGDVVAAAGQDTPVAITGAKPATLTGSGRVGSQLRVDFSEGMDLLVDYLGAVGGPGLAPTLTWLRDGSPIAAAQDDDRYRPVGADVGKKISVRIAYTGAALSQFQMISGGTLTPRTTNKIEIEKIPSHAYIRLVKPSISSDRHAVVRVDATAPGQVLDGRAKVTIGDWSQTKALRNGVARFRAPLLEPGTYDVKAAYLGSRTFGGATAKKRVLTVTK